MLSDRFLDDGYCSRTAGRWSSWCNTDNIVPGSAAGHSSFPYELGGDLNAHYPIDPWPGGFIITNERHALCDSNQRYFCYYYWLPKTAVSIVPRF
jgi:hypothetical protein